MCDELLQKAQFDFLDPDPGGDMNPDPLGSGSETIGTMYYNLQVPLLCKMFTSRDFSGPSEDLDARTVEQLGAKQLADAFEQLNSLLMHLSS